MRYLVIGPSDIDQLQSDVEAHTRRGWKPQGGVVVNWEKHLFVQAMVHSYIVDTKSGGDQLHRKVAQHEFDT